MYMPVYRMKSTAAVFAMQPAATRASQLVVQFHVVITLEYQARFLLPVQHLKYAVSGPDILADRLIALTLRRALQCHFICVNVSINNAI